MNPMRPLILSASLAAMALLLQSCREEFPNGPRVPTTPVVGQVRVDGQPANYLAVTCEPQFEKAGTVPDSSAFTDKDGKFSLSTFEHGDGLPLGKYKLTFYWGQINMMNGQYGGPDKLNNKYRKAADSTIEFEVAKEKLDLGTIELTTKK